MKPRLPRLLLQTVCFTLIQVPAWAQWAVTPYSTAHLGGNFEMDWSQPFDKEAYYIGKKVGFGGMPTFVGIGGLLNPTLVDG